jgi:hypothetical protein
METAGNTVNEIVPVWPARKARVPDCSAHVRVAGQPEASNTAMGSR